MCIGVLFKIFFDGVFVMCDGVDGVCDGDDGFGDIFCDW